MCRNMPPARRAAKEPVRPAAATQTGSADRVARTALPRTSGDRARRGRTALARASPSSAEAIRVTRRCCRCRSDAEGQPSALSGPRVTVSRQAGAGSAGSGGRRPDHHALRGHRQGLQRHQDRPPRAPAPVTPRIPDKNPSRRAPRRGATGHEAPRQLLEGSTRFPRRRTHSQTRLTCAVPRRVVYASGRISCQPRPGLPARQSRSAED